MATVQEYALPSLRPQWWGNPYLDQWEALNAASSRRWFVWPPNNYLCAHDKPRLTSCIHQPRRQVPFVLSGVNQWIVNEQNFDTSHFAADFRFAVSIRYDSSQQPQNTVLIVTDVDPAESININKSIGVYLFWACKGATKPRREEHWWYSTNQVAEEYRQLLEEVYAIDKVGDPRRAMDPLVDAVDDLLKSSEFDGCKVLLVEADPEKLSDPLIVSLLGVTLGAKKKLQPERSNFYRRALSAVEKRRGVDGANRLLSKYL